MIEVPSANYPARFYEPGCNGPAQGVTNRQPAAFTPNARLENSSARSGSSSLRTRSALPPIASPHTLSRGKSLFVNKRHLQPCVMQSQSTGTTGWTGAKDHDIVGIHTGGGGINCYFRRRIYQSSCGFIDPEHPYPGACPPGFTFAASWRCHGPYSGRGWSLPACPAREI